MEIALLVGVAFSVGCLVGGFIIGVMLGKNLQEQERFYTEVNTNLTESVDKLFIPRR